MISYRRARYASAIATLIVGVALSHAQSNSPLRLEKTIPLPGVKGRIDHLAFDTDNERLFVAALGNNTVEVIDVKSAKVIRTIAGLAEPQGVIYQPERKRLWVANASDGKVRVFDALTFQPLRSIELGDDADNIRRDGATQHIFVGYGKGGLATFDSEGNKVADIKVDAHPESFQLEKNGPRMFVNLPNSQKVAVIDRTKAAVVGSWTTDDAQSNFPMALDEADGRLFIVCRKPAVLLVLDTKSGTVVAETSDCGRFRRCLLRSKAQTHLRVGRRGSDCCVSAAGCRPLQQDFPARHRERRTHKPICPRTEPSFPGRAAGGRERGGDQNLQCK